jgi:hypothetical protein
VRGHNFQYDEVVVGNNLPAIFYSYIHQTPLVFKLDNNIFFYEHYEPDYPLDKLFLLNESAELNTPTGIKKVGVQKATIFNRLLFILSLSGLAPLSDKVEKIRLEEGNLLKIITNRGRTVKIKFNKLRIFNPEIVEGLDTTFETKEKYLVHDLVKLKSKDHPYNMLNVGDEFIKDIHFYGRKRKDLLVVSSLTEAELIDFDYSSIPLKYKLKEILLKGGVEKTKFQSQIVVEHLGRNVYDNKKKGFKPTESVFLDERKEKEICQEITKKAHLPLLGVYPWKLNYLLLDSSGMTR